MILRLAYAPPLDWESTLDFLSGRCTAGVEQVEGGAYRRTARIGRRRGWLAVTAEPGRAALRVEVSPSLAPVRESLAARLRAVFDLDLDPPRVARVLSRDRLLAPSLRRHPGLRVNGAFDAFEAAVRVVLGQQVSVRAATTVAGRLAATLGEPVRTPFPGLDRLAPRAAALLRAGEDRIAGVGMPGARARTLLALARAVEEGELVLERGGDPDGVRERMLALPGVGPWTANLVAMRALGAPDAFPAGDLGVLRAIGARDAREAEARAQAWRPFRAYAAMHLWNLAVIRRSTSGSPRPGP
jgi:AraC family transcriptional regulator of adaptative response / DNA-3-methyladenine glycosylase II